MADDNAAPVELRASDLEEVSRPPNAKKVDAIAPPGAVTRVVVCGLLDLTAVFLYALAGAQAVLTPDALQALLSDTAADAAVSVLAAAPKVPGVFWGLCVVASVHALALGGDEVVRDAIREIGRRAPGGRG